MRVPLAIFLKWPQAGSVKTRLAAEIGTEAATAAYREMVERLRDRAREDWADAFAVCWYYTPAGREEAFRRWLDPGGRTAWRAQPDGDLGARQAAWLRGRRDPVILLGSDCLEVTRGDLDEAVRLLATGIDVVFGPAMDGGYYLLASARDVSACLDGVPWSRTDTLERILENVRARGWRAGLLAPRADIDSAADLERARKGGWL